jgi:hypothetical protein
MRKWLIGVGVVAILVALGFVIALRVFAPDLRKLAYERTQGYLAGHFKSTVEFADFQVTLRPRLRVVVSGVVLRHQGRTDIPPLLEIRTLTIDADPGSLMSHHPEVTSVRLDGLRIQMPPRMPGGKPLLHGTDQNLAEKYPVIIREIRADDALLVILRKPADAGKPPREFAIHQLVMRDFNFSSPATFHALLTNPVPTGEIHCDGKFGPWQADDPRTTPLDAQYTFRNADMSTLKGLRGTLSSDGKFSGPLDYLSVQGTTDIPDFALRISSHPMALHTDFDAIVDGTNGDVLLNKVVSKFLHTTLTTKGKVVDENRAVKGRTILMDTVSQGARIEDLLLLAVKSEPPVMTGAAKLKAHVLIPENDREDLIERLKIDGQFDVSEAEFAKDSVQGKIDSLSRRGLGKPKDTELSNAHSDLKGTFQVASSEVAFSQLEFQVPGASIRLTGKYNMDGGQMDFRGKLRLQAKLSQTMTGAKSFFLRAVDPFFKGKNGAGTELPIKIGGTKDHPAFGLDFRDKANNE